MPGKNIDYSLYLVTDSTPAILGDKDLVSVVKAAIEGGRPLFLSPEGIFLRVLTYGRCHDSAIP